MVIRINRKQSPKTMRKQANLLAKEKGKRAAAAARTKAQNIKLYQERVKARCAVLPFSAEELRLSGVSELETPEQRMFAWWRLVAVKVLSDTEFIPDVFAEDTISQDVWDYLMYHEKVAATLVTGKEFANEYCMAERIRSTRTSSRRVREAFEYAQKFSYRGKTNLNERPKSDGLIHEYPKMDTSVPCRDKISHETLSQNINCIEWVNRSWAGSDLNLWIGVCLGCCIGVFITFILATVISDLILWLVSLVFIMFGFGFLGGYISDFICGKLPAPEHKTRDSYIHSIWGHCECLPLTNHELESLRITDKTSSPKKLAAWWSFVIVAILTDQKWSTNPCLGKFFDDLQCDYLAMFDLPEELQLFLLQQADEAGKLFFGELPQSLNQSKILDYAWSATRQIAMGGLTPKKAETHIAELIQKQIG